MNAVALHSRFTVELTNRRRSVSQLVYCGIASQPVLCGIVYMNAVASHSHFAVELTIKRRSDSQLVYCGIDQDNEIIEHLTNCIAYGASQ
eukprot:gene5512-2448_t